MFWQRFCWRSHGYLLNCCTMKARLYLNALFALIILYIITSPAHAQVVRVDSLSNWKKAFKAGLNLNQAAFSGNWKAGGINRSEEHTSELQSLAYLVCRLLL